MKKISVITFLSLILVFLPFKSFAAVTLLPFGGKTLTTLMPGVICPGGEGPITLLPLSISPAGIYAVFPETQRHLTGTITPGSWVLGIYFATPIPLCYTQTTPPIPVPVFIIHLFGSSLPSL